MSKIDDGGQAFPNTYPVDCSSAGTIGMSLRDWFAGRALSGLLEYESNPKDAASFATDAYRFADAMIAARKVKPEGDA